MHFPNVSAPGFALQPLCLTDVEATTDQALAMIKANAPPGTKGFIGESALTGGGGHDGVTNAFVSSMWYADWLGAAAKRGVHAVMRETLVGGLYGIVNRSSYAPAPDAFTMALHNALMGPGVLAVNVSVVVPHEPGGDSRVGQMLRAYAHQSKGGSQSAVTLLMINIGSDTAFAVGPPPGAAAPGQRMEWHLTAADGDISAKRIMLNGKLLELATPTSTALPPMPGRPAPTADPILVAPASVVFVALSQ